MTERNSADYYRRRHRQALALAAAADNRDIAEIHKAMAEQYLRIIAAIALETSSRQDGQKASAAAYKI